MQDHTSIYMCANWGEMDVNLPFLRRCFFRSCVCRPFGLRPRLTVVLFWKAPLAFLELISCIFLAPLTGRLGGTGTFTTPS